MPSKRIIARLDIKSNFVVKGLQFEGLRKVGNPKELITKYCEDGADEILLNDVVASLYERNHLIEIITYVVEELRVPLAVMGGLNSIDDVKALFDAGADKIGINSYGFINPKIYENVAQKYGNQSVILSIEAAKFKSSETYECLVQSGRNRTNITVQNRLDFFENSGAGELLVTSVESDGMLCGPETKLIELLSTHSKYPKMYGGGIRNAVDVLTVFSAGFDACVIGSSLHYSKISINEIKKSLSNTEFEIRR